MLTSSPSRSLRSDGLATDTVAASQAAKVIATPILVSIIMLVFCAQIILSHFGVDLIALGGGSVLRFAAGEWWRIVTPVVLHNSALQVLVCLFGLLVTGPTLERTIGTLPFCCVCVGGVVGSSLAHFQFFASTVLLGAAGAFWAIVGGTLALTVVRGVPIRAPQHLLLQAMSTPLCLFSLTVSYSLISIIDHDAYAISHAGGFVSGFVTILVAPFGARQVRTFEAMGAVTVGLVVLSGLLYPQPRSREAAALTEAKTLIKMDDFAAATRVLESASAAYPASAAIHHLLGVCYLVKGNASGSLRHLEEACRLRPSNAEFRTDLGKLYFEAGRYDAAIANLTEAVRLAPKHFRSNYLLALALAKKRDFFAAKEAIDHAVELNPSSADAYVVLACLNVEFGKYRDASTALRKAVQLNPAVNFPQELRYFIPLN